MPVSVNSLGGVKALAGGEFHACALIFGGTVKCWGYGSFGALGYGGIANKSSPTSVKGL